MFDSKLPRHSREDKELDNDYGNPISYSTVLGVPIPYSDSKAIAGMEVVEVAGCYMPENVLGMTDCIKKIWIRYGLGYLKKHVLIHEIEHVKDPMASEYIIRLRAKQREPVHYVI
ncbi:MAG: hypothetical protein HYT71_02685 [Candidatus Aenigmarchaeota archaeon]|nr:hypothetical protein [Candidatus Aenigmarchaeota archaeon]